MGRQRGQTCVVERILIIRHLKIGISYREIGKMVNGSHSTVQSMYIRSLQK